MKPMNEANRLIRLFFTQLNHQLRSKEGEPIKIDVKVWLSDEWPKSYRMIEENEKADIYFYPYDKRGDIFGWDDQPKIKNIAELADMKPIKAEWVMCIDSENGTNTLYYVPHIILY